MRKTRIEIRADIIAQGNACKTASLAADDWRNLTIDMADSNNEANIDFANMDLVDIEVHIKTLLADSV